MTEIVDRYIHDFAFEQKDPFLHPIKLYDITDLSGFWKFLQTSRNDPMAELPFWAHIWPGGKVLARYILDHKEQFSGKRILDFACGSGVTSIAAALAGGIVTGYDIDPDAIALARQASAINGCSIPFHLEDPLESDLFSDYDIILAGDVFYEEQLAKKALSWLGQAATMGKICLAGDAARMYRPRQGAQIMARYRIPVNRDVEGISALDCQVLRILAPDDKTTFP